MDWMVLKKQNSSDFKITKLFGASSMTLPYERRRALEWAGDLLREIRQESGEIERWGAPLPPKLRESALRILRHYPEPWQIKDATQMTETPVCNWVAEEPPDKNPKLDTQLHSAILQRQTMMPSTYKSAIHALQKLQNEKSFSDKRTESKDG
jgi:hypothetical protein